MYANQAEPSPSIEDRPTSIKAALNYPLLTAEEERPLVLAAKRGNRRAADRLILHNLRLVSSQAQKFTYATYEDRFQAGVLGIHTAIHKYRPEEGTRFGSCAYFYVRNEIRALEPGYSGLIEDMGWMPDEAGADGTLAIHCNPLAHFQLVIDSFLDTLLNRFDYYLQKQLSKLPPEFHDLATLRWLGNTFAIIAQKLETPCSTLKSRYTRMVNRYLTPPSDGGWVRRRLSQIKQKVSSVFRNTSPSHSPPNRTMKLNPVAKAASVLGLSSLLTFGTSAPAAVVAWTATYISVLWHLNRRLAYVFMGLGAFLLFLGTADPAHAQWFGTTETWVKTAFPGADDGWSLIFNAYRAFVIFGTLGYLAYVGPRIFKRELDGDALMPPVWFWIILLIVDFFLTLITGNVTGGGGGANPVPGPGGAVPGAGAGGG